MTDWQHISTAPKDDTEIIGAYIDRDTVYGPWTIRFSPEMGEWVSSWGGSRVIESESAISGTTYKYPDVAPTHWFPLPVLISPKIDDQLEIAASLLSRANFYNSMDRITAEALIRDIQSRLTASEDGYIRQWDDEAKSYVYIMSKDALAASPSTENMEG